MFLYKLIDKRELDRLTKFEDTAIFLQEYNGDNKVFLTVFEAIIYYKNNLHTYNNILYSSEIKDTDKFILLEFKVDQSIIIKDFIDNLSYNDIVYKLYPKRYKSLTLHGNSFFGYDFVNDYLEIANLYLIDSKTIRNIKPDININIITELEKLEFHNISNTLLKQPELTEKMINIEDIDTELLSKIEPTFKDCTSKVLCLYIFSKLAISDNKNDMISPNEIIDMISVQSDILTEFFDKHSKLNLNDLLNFKSEELIKYIDTLDNLFSDDFKDAVLCFETDELKHIILTEYIDLDLLTRKK